MIEVTDLSLALGGRLLLDRVDLQVLPGETYALLGPSGCGKSSLARLLSGLLPGRPAARETLAARSAAGARWAGAARVCGTDMLAAGPRRLRRLSGRAIGLVVQGLGDALNPHLTVAGHVAEMLAVHGGDGRSVCEICLDHDLPEGLHHRYPAHLSGGEIQRVLLALALIPRPRVLILDEPTASLDPASRDRALRSLARRAQERAQILITHDRDLAARFADRAGWLEDGRLRPGLPARRPPATARCDAAASASCLAGAPARLRLRGVGHAVGSRCLFDGVSLTVASGGCATVCGPSGSGKSTLARLAAGLIAPQQGEVAVVDAARDGGHGCQAMPPRAACALVSQHPHRAMPPHFTVREVLAEVLQAPERRPARVWPWPRRAARAAMDDRIVRLLTQVGLPVAADFLGRRVGVLSGGEAQRLAIARALARAPAFLVADEPTAALDADTRDQIVRLLADLVRRGAGLLLVTHDPVVAATLGGVRHTLDAGVLMRLPDGERRGPAPASRPGAGAGVASGRAEHG